MTVTRAAWDRARWPRRCGYCGETIAVGAPIFVYAVGDKPVEKIRCTTCAGPAPPDLPARPLLVPRPKPLAWTRFTTGRLPLDFKARAIGEREPGEEG